tara:strand:+ start:177 stop:476 length:300 start_codon:yes stop_codon:yes gene_type:complete
MTVQQYLDKMERQLEETLTKNLQKYIPAILERVEKLSVEKFINEGDPVLDIIEFKTIFDKIITEALQRIYNQNQEEGIFQTITIKDLDEKTLTFRIGLN